VAGLTGSLVVLRVPEEVIVAFVWNYVVDDGGRSYLLWFLLQAIFTERMLLEEDLPVFPPPGVIPPGVRTAALPVIMPAGIF
jgi:hypothetical protein